MKLFTSNLILIGINLLLINFMKCEEPKVVYDFPENFKFGAASAAYQIEGAWNVDGKTPSIWDTFTHEHPELIIDHSTGDISDDSYHFYQKDIEALKEIGFHHYRFSISWPRVLVNGSVLNPKGIEYYNKLIDALLDENIEPIATMYHWDLPQYIQDLGGFTNPLFVKYFEHFADVLYTHFGDRVKKWITFNEPFNFCIDGYSNGRMAPGVKAPGIGEYLCAHHMLQAHASAFHLYKRKYFDKQQGQVGISLNSRSHYPQDDLVGEGLAERAQEFRLGWFANPIFSKDGGYPRVMVETIGNKSSAEGRPWSRLPVMNDELKKFLKGSADFLALNYYTSRLVRPRKATPSFEPSFDEDLGLDYFVDEKWTRGKSSWLYNVPEGLYDLLKEIKDKYDNPTVLIAENGFSDEGEIEDVARIQYLKGHIASVSRAAKEGCNIIGYTVWSIIDNFEWIAGFTEKFGIFAVDMNSETKERTKKSSALFMEKLIKNKNFEF